MLFTCSTFLKRLLSFTLLFLYNNNNICAGLSNDQIIILISYDGFRYDYLDKYKEVLPTLRKMASEGVRADYMQNVYPTETFPNHYSIVTGLYPESHGIVANNMYDPVFNASFTMKTNDSRWWQEGEPIWVTSEKAGHKTGVSYWPGYDAVIRGFQPSYRPMNTSNSMSWNERVDVIIGWLSVTNPPAFICSYFAEPDRTGLKYGTNSLQIQQMLNKLDNDTWYLIHRLKQLEIFDRINVIFTAGNGMIDYQSRNVFDMNEYVDPQLYTFWSQGSTMFLLSNTSNSSLDDLYHKLKKAEKETGMIRFYKKEDIPERFHYRRNRRIADILGVLNPGFVLNTGGTKSNANQTYGIHGYVASLAEMHPYFIAHGPAFKQEYRSGPIQMIDLYPMMCHILNIEPAPNNGSLTRIQHLLSRKHFFTNNTAVTIAISCTVAAIAFSIIVYICLKKIENRKWGNGQSVGFKRGTNDSYKLLADFDEEEDEVIFFDAIGMARA